jgi:hypothetical protein
VGKAKASLHAPNDIGRRCFTTTVKDITITLPKSGSGTSTNGARPLEFSGITWETANGQYSANQPLILSWPSTLGAGYQVQFKDNLTDPEWQPLDVPATVVGNQGQTIDLSPNAIQRFYRIVSF